MTRQHHCRGCGQVFCSKCSAKACPIPKFGIEKEVGNMFVCGHRPKTKELLELLFFFIFLISSLKEFKWKNPVADFGPALVLLFNPPSLTLSIPYKKGSASDYCNYWIAAQGCPIMTQCPSLIRPWWMGSESPGPCSTWLKATYQRGWNYSLQVWRKRSLLCQLKCLLVVPLYSQT